MLEVCPTRIVWQNVLRLSHGSHPTRIRHTEQSDGIWLCQLLWRWHNHMPSLCKTWGDTLQHFMPVAWRTNKNNQGRWDACQKSAVIEIILALIAFLTDKLSTSDLCSILRFTKTVWMDACIILNYAAWDLSIRWCSRRPACMTAQKCSFVANCDHNMRPDLAKWVLSRTLRNDARDLENENDLNLP